jgi:mycothiol synthase
VVQLQWRGALSGADIADVQALVAAATEVDGTAPLSEHVLLHLRHGGDAEAAQLLAREGDELVGFAHLDLTDPVAGGAGELVVHPSTAGGPRLAHRAGAPRPGGPVGGGGRAAAAVGARRAPGAVALATTLGFTQARVLWQMRRSLLAPLAEPHLPEGVRLRPFVVGADEREFLRVNNAAFDWHPEQGGWDLDQVKLREAEPWFDPNGFLLAVDADDRLLGFHWTKVHGDGGHSHEPIGEVYVLGVDPSARGMHLGAALTLAGLRHLRDRRPAPGDVVRRGRQRRRRARLPRPGLHPVGHRRLVRPLVSWRSPSRGLTSIGPE